MKKLIVFCLIVVLCYSSVFAKTRPAFDSNKAIKDTGKIEFNEISAVDACKDMGAGWNLGNTLDAIGSKTLSSETSWGMPKTSKEIIDGIASSGIKTIRIPISWGNHIIDSSYTIDPKWMSRVKEIVDWAIEDGLYVIINTHHDNCNSSSSVKNGYYPDKANYATSEAFFVNVWSQIALAFNNGYDSHLIFETMNEPRLCGTNGDLEWNFKPDNPKSKESAEVLNQLNQTIVDLVRKTGGNNKKRLIMCPGYAAAPYSVLCDAFTVPKDVEPNHIMISVHMYTPYIFAGQSPGTKTYNVKMQNEIALTFKKLNEKFIKNGYGVVIGEYGATNKDNLDQRVLWFSAFIKYSRFQGLAACVWDNGVWKIKEGTTDYSEKFGYFDRRELKWFFPEILDAILQNQ